MSGPAAEQRCDHELVFELADGGLDGETCETLRDHLKGCVDCRELYEHELGLNAYLASLDFPEPRHPSVHEGVAMALPTRSPFARLAWGAIAAVLLALALVYLELHGTEPVIMAMNLLAAGWGFVSGSAGVAHAVFAAVGPIILLALCVGAVADLLLALVFVSIHRGRRARGA